MDESVRDTLEEYGLTEATLLEGLNDKMETHRAEVDSMSFERAQLIYDRLATIMLDDNNTNKSLIIDKITILALLKPVELRGDVAYGFTRYIDGVPSVFFIEIEE